MNFNIKKVRNKLDVIDFLLYLFAGLTILRGTLGIVLYIPFYNNSSIYFFLYIIWLLLACVRCSTFVFCLLKYTKWLVVFLYTNITFDLLFNSGISIVMKNYLNLFIIYSIAIYYKDGHEKFKKILLLFLLIDCSTMIINTFIVMVDDPTISRRLASTDGVEEYIGNANMIASFALIYSSVLVFTFLFSSLKSYHKYIKIVILIFLILFLVLLLKASYFYAIIITLICIALSKIPKNKIFLPLFCAIMVIVFIIFKESIARIIYELARTSFKNPITSSKLEDIYKFIIYGYRASEQFVDRLVRYNKSILAFQENPLFGVFSTWKRNVLEYGGHSTMFDSLAMFGILRLFPFVIFMGEAYSQTLKALPERLKKSYHLTFFAFLCISAINPIIFSQTWIALFIIPVFLVSYIQKNYEKETEAANKIKSK